MPVLVQNAYSYNYTGHTLTLWMNLAAVHLTMFHCKLQCMQVCMMLWPLMLKGITIDAMNKMHNITLLKDCYLSWFLYRVSGDTEHVTKLLMDHSKVHMITGDVEAVEKITIRRSHIWGDTLRAWRRQLDLRKRIKVTFLGEPAVDEGGPRREFLRLLMKAVSEQSSLLAGPPTRKVLLHNSLAMSKGHYRCMGEMIVMSLMQGGPGPAFFSPTVIDYVLGGISKVKPSIGDIPDYHVQEMLKKVGFTSNLANKVDPKLTMQLLAFSIRCKQQTVMKK